MEEAEAVIEQVKAGTFEWPHHAPDEIFDTSILPIPACPSPFKAGDKVGVGRYESGEVGVITAAGPHLNDPHTVAWSDGRVWETTGRYPRPL